MEYRKIKYLWVIIFMVVLIWSGINPKDQLTWLLEVSPAIIGGALLATTYQSFRLTPVLYFFILLHCIVLMIGGHYTYAEVPLFDGLFGAERNNYDKVGHFFQGFVPALLAREILIRKDVVNGDCWRNFLIVSICLAFSAFYELTQGYVWDTQSDMLLALVGAICSLLVLSTTHNAQLKKVTSQGKQT